MRAFLQTFLLSFIFVFGSFQPTLQAAPKTKSKQVKKKKKKLSKAARRRIAKRRAAKRRRALRRKARLAKRRAAQRRAKAKRTRKKVKVAQKLDPKIVEARTAFMAGRKLFNEKNYAAAIVQYNRAYSITNDKLVKGQVALAFEKAGDYKRALESIKVYRSALPLADRGSVDQMITRYEELIAQGQSKHLVLPGEEVIAAKPKEKVVAEKAPIPLPLAPEPLKEPDLDTPISSDAPKSLTEPPKKKGRLWTWIALGTSGALAVGAVVTGLSAKSKYDDLESSCAPNCSDKDIDSVENRAIATDILWGSALAFGVTAAILYFVEGSDVKDDKKENLVRVAPIMGQGSYGLGAEIRY